MDEFSKDDLVSTEKIDFGAGISCIICGFSFKSVLAYHEHNIKQHSQIELSRAVLHLRNLELNFNDPGVLGVESNRDYLCSPFDSLEDLVNSLDFFPLTPWQDDQEIIELKPTKDNKDLRVESRLVRYLEECQKHPQQVITVKERSTSVTHAAKLRNGDGDLTDQKNSVISVDTCKRKKQSKKGQEENLVKLQENLELRAESDMCVPHVITRSGRKRKNNRSDSYVYYTGKNLVRKERSAKIEDVRSVEVKDDKSLLSHDASFKLPTMVESADVKNNSILDVALDKCSSKEFIEIVNDDLDFLDQFEFQINFPCNYEIRDLLSQELLLSPDDYLDNCLADGKLLKDPIPQNLLFNIPETSDLSTSGCDPVVTSNTTSNEVASNGDSFNFHEADYCFTEIKHLSCVGVGDGLISNVHGKTLSDPQDSVDSLLENNKNKQRSLFTCGICKKNFSSRYYFILHKSKYHDNTQWMKFQCSLCSKRFGFQAALERHLKEHTLSNKIACQYCSKEFKKYSSMVAHAALHTRESVFGCDVCPKQFYSKLSLKKHMKYHKGANFSCNFCSKKFFGRSYLLRHLARHEFGGNLGLSSDWKCNFCSDVKSVIELAQTDEFKNGHHVTCLMCKKGLYKKFLVQNPETVPSVVTEHRERQQCTLCSKWVLNLKKHVMYTHQKNKSVVCDICKAVIKKDSLKSHKNRKHGGPCVRCDHCNKIFKNILAFHEHLSKVRKKNI